jgi:MFS family permease
MLKELTNSPIKVSEPDRNWSKILVTLAIVGLGMLVDVYDVWLFTIVRTPSLKDLGIAQSNLLSSGLTLLNIQMVGMVLGGFIWGILGDKRGRKSILFGSIVLYSLANLLNGYVQDVTSYSILRFLAGIGLAGEVGAALTIAAEITPRKYRAYGTAFVTAMAYAGSILASLLASTMPWRVAFVTAGLAGFLLLLLRTTMAETGLFIEIEKKSEVKRGDLLLFFQCKRGLKLLYCVVAGIPVWFGAGLIVACAPELAKSNSIQLVTVAQVALSYTIGQALGNIACSILSQRLASRKKAILVFQFGAALSTAVLLAHQGQYYVALCLPVGFFMGSFTMLLTTAAEQFGTNLRSTASSVVPNLVRASIIPLSLSFTALTPLYGPGWAAGITGIVCFTTAIAAILKMEDTFNKELNFLDS